MSKVEVTGWKDGRLNRGQGYYGLYFNSVALNSNRPLREVSLSSRETEVLRVILRSWDWSEPEVNVPLGKLGGFPDPQMNSQNKVKRCEIEYCMCILTHSPLILSRVSWFLPS